MQTDDLFKNEPINDWDKLIKIFNKHTKDGKQWVFRGEKKFNCQLKTSLERAVISWGKKIENTSEIELKLIREFKRKAKIYADNVDDLNCIELVALMRHHGSPTRLLDWTYSFFIAVYFALEEAVNSDCYVWAINSDLFVENNRKILRDKIDHPDADNLILKELLNGNHERRVYILNPSGFNIRLAIQQGVFICPGDPSVSFIENLSANLISDSKSNIIRYEIKYDLKLRCEILEKLHRMNINRASLFPDIDGFAKSLGTFPIFLKNPSKVDSTKRIKCD